MNQNTDPTEAAEVMPPSAIMALERAAIDSQVATAHAYPRSIETFKRKSMSMATLDAETAEQCLYCRPVGKEKNDKGAWVQKFAEGASIRLAEIVAASYCNLRVAARIIEQTERFVRCEGVAHDLESNYAGKSECVESTVTREGAPYSERQRALMAKVCLAKAYRDAIFKVVPRALCKPVYEAAKKVAAGQGQTLEQRRNKVKAWLDSRKIDETRMFASLDVNGWSEIGEDELLTLTGLKTSVTDGDVTIDEAFPPIVKTAQTGPQTQQPAAAAASQQPAAAAQTPGPLKEPKKAPAAAEAKPEAKAAALAPTPEAAKKVDLPKCKFCGSEVEDMAKHNCAQMQAATASQQVAGAQADPNAPAADSREALAAVKSLLKENGITEEVFIRYCEANKITRKGQNKLDQLSTAKLVQIASVFQKIVGEVAKFKEA